MFVPMTGKWHEAWCCTSLAASSVLLPRNHRIYKVI